MAQSAVLARSFALPRFASHNVTVEWLFRIGIATCFIGHGAFGIITKEAWLPYFGLIGIGNEAALRLMPLVGALDIAVGIVGLLSPRRAVLVYMGVWAVWTAMLRPLTGESAWEFVERAGNYGVPLAFLVAVGVGPVRSWWERLRTTDLMLFDADRVRVVLRATTVMVLVGHGALAVTGANGNLAAQLGAIGLPAAWAVPVGGFEIALGVLVAAASVPVLLVGIAGWKLLTESLFVAAGAPVWEVIERGGSYTAPLLLAALLMTSSGRHRDDRPFSAMNSNQERV